MDEGEKFQIQIILNSYTSKFIHYYMEHKQLPSIATMKQMQRETLDEPPPEVVSLITPRKRD